MKKSSIIFLHGGPGFKDYLGPYFSNLKDDFSCVFYDQKRGAKVLVEELVLELNKFVENQEGKPVLLGHSWGGVLAVEYAKKFQNKISGLVLMSTGLSASQWVQYRSEFEELGLDNVTPEEMFLTPMELENGKKLLDETWKSFSEETFDSISESYLKNYDLLDSLAEIRVPILNIFGEKDLRFSQKVTKSFRNYNEAIINMEVENAGHFPFLEKNNRKKIAFLIKKYFK